MSRVAFCLDRGRLVLLVAGLLETAVISPLPCVPSSPCQQRPRHTRKKPALWNSLPCRRPFEKTLLFRSQIIHSFAHDLRPFHELAPSLPAGWEMRPQGQARPAGRKLPPRQPQPGCSHPDLEQRLGAGMGLSLGSPLRRGGSPTCGAGAGRRGLAALVPSSRQRATGGQLPTAYGATGN